MTAGGKTTLSRALLKLNPDTIIISFDDYSIDALPSAPSFDFFKENPLVAINQYDLSALMNDFKPQSNPQEIFDWCQTYIQFVHPLVALHEKIVLPSCDLVLDGTKPPEQNALQLLQFIQAKS